MEKTKKLLSLFLSLVMLLSITSGINLTALAITSGDFEYTILDDGTAEITEYRGESNELIIPSEFDGYTVTSIGDSAFHECISLTSVTIPDSVTSIGYYAFYCCESLTSITIPDSVTSIGDYAFYNCRSLASITIPNSVTGIGYCAFQNCRNLRSITIPGSVTSIGDDAFDICRSLTSINVDSNNKNYSSEDGVLFNISKTELIQYPTGNIRTSYTIPNSVTSIGNRAFSDSNSLTSITIPDSVTNIDRYAFSDCNSLTSITIPNSATSIGDGAFSFCESLTSITIPNSITSIGHGAFDGCKSLKDVYYSGMIEQWNEIKIGEYNQNLTSAQIHFNAVGHSYDSGKITKQPTCTAKGVKTYTCTVCGETKTEAVAKKDHTYKTTLTKATTSKNGSSVTKCTVCGNVKSKSTIYYPKSITLSTTSYVYNGKAKKPSVTVKDSKGKVLKNGTDYTVSYPSGRKNVGKYTVTIKFKGNYSGTVKKTFTIKPKSASISKLTAGKKKFTVKWKKQTTQTTGYQIQYSTSSKFSNAKTVTVSKNSTTSKTISKLKAKKKYYVRIRTYKTVKVNGKSTKIYSSWSKAKTVTTKK